MKTINAAGLALVKAREGLFLKAYQDVVGVWTIGWGHTGKDVHPGLVIDEARAEALLYADMQGSEQWVTKLVTVPLTDNQFAALVSLVFNVGQGCLIHTHLIADLEAKNYAKAANDILSWNHAGGRVVRGLTLRRQAERKLFLTP